MNTPPTVALPLCLDGMNWEGKTLVNWHELCEELCARVAAHYEGLITAVDGGTASRIMVHVAGIGVSEREEAGEDNVTIAWLQASRATRHDAGRAAGKLKAPRHPVTGFRLYVKGELDAILAHAPMPEATKARKRRRRTKR